MSKALAEPEKELRFTRSAQAQQFALLAAFCIAASVCTFFCAYLNWGPQDYTLKNYWWVSLLPLIPAFFFLRLAFRCVKHAYIILSPLGIEVFPFYKPEKNLQVIYWAQIHHATFQDEKMFLHFNKERSGGIVTTLRPIRKQRWPLLQQAVEGRLPMSKIHNTPVEK